MTHKKSPPYILTVNGEPRSSCHNAELEVSREVHDTVVFTVEGYDASDAMTSTLTVRYAKVYEGDADRFVVQCSQCLAVIDNVDVNEA